MTANPVEATLAWIDALEQDADMTPFEMIKWALHGIAAATGHIVSTEDDGRVVAENEATLNTLGAAPARDRVPRDHLRTSGAPAMSLPVLKQVWHASSTGALSGGTGRQESSACRGGRTGGALWRLVGCPLHPRSRLCARSETWRTLGAAMNALRERR